MEREAVGVAGLHGLEAATGAVLYDHDPREMGVLAGEIYDLHVT